MGRRALWDDLPGPVRARIDGLVGAPVVQARSQEGGYSPAFASRCLLDDGRRIFVKAVSATLNPDNPAILRREIQAWSFLPEGVPGARLIASDDDGEWVMAAFDDVEGRMPPPWRPGDLDAVVDALDRLDRVPLPRSGAVPAAEEKLRPAFGNWQRLTQEGTPLGGWVDAHIDELVTLEAEWPDAVRGDQLVHGDLRGDNILFDGQGRPVFIDWTDACRGNSLFDLVAMVPSLVLDGCGPPESIFGQGHRLDSTEPRLVAILAISIAGYFLHRSLQPAPLGLPTLRQFQAAQAQVCLDWIPALVRAL
jgi:Phosphotransferase enzyme family